MSSGDDRACALVLNCGEGHSNCVVVLVSNGWLFWCLRVSRTRMWKPGSLARGAELPTSSVAALTFEARMMGVGRWGEGEGDVRAVHERVWGCSSVGVK